MRAPALAEVTHSRTVFVIYGLLIAVMGLVALVLTVLLAVASSDPSSVLFGLGFATPVLLHGLLLPFSTPATGSFAGNLRIYKLEAVIVVLFPLAATVVASLLQYWGTFALLLPISIGVLYLVLQIDWGDVRLHLRHVRDADDPDSVRFIPAEGTQFGLHVSFGVVLAVVGSGLAATPFPLSGLGLPDAFPDLLGLAFVLAGGALLGATPHRGTVDRTVLAMKVLFMGPGLCLVLVGPVVLVLGTTTVPTVALAGVVTSFGITLLYLGFERVSWGEVARIVEEMRSADEVTWKRAFEVTDASTSKPEDATARESFRS